jgi:hypothetical protein
MRSSRSTEPSYAARLIGCVEEIRVRLGSKGIGRGIEAQEVGGFVLREEAGPYSAVFCPQNSRFSPDNGCYWDVLFADSMIYPGPTPCASRFLVTAQNP